MFEICTVENSLPHESVRRQALRFAGILKSIHGAKTSLAEPELTGLEEGNRFNCLQDMEKILASVLLDGVLREDGTNELRRFVKGVIVVVRSDITNESRQSRGCCTRKHSSDVKTDTVQYVQVRGSLENRPTLASKPQRYRGVVCDALSRLRKIQ